MKLDHIDKQILNVIIANARTPFKEIAQICGLSRAAVHQRVSRMVEDGVITGSGYHIDYKRLGYGTLTYVGIRLEYASAYQSVRDNIFDIEEVVECHFTTGDFALLVKLYARDNEHLMHLLVEKIQNIEGVLATEAMISLKECFSRPLFVSEEG